jgi:hypothetical protein
MQTDNAKQGSGLKKIAGWTIGTIAAWAVTKMFDSYYDVSLFSSMYAAVGAWLSQTIPVHLWLFCVAGIVVAVAVPLGVWSFLDKRLEVGLAKAEQEKAFVKAREAITELNAVDAKLNATTKELNTTKLELDATRSELNAAQAKIADLETPKVQPLTESHHIVLAGIEIYDNADKPCYVKDLSQKIKFTMVQTEGAVDVLVKRKLVEEYYTNGGRGVSLTPDGRAYVLHPDFDMSHLPL